MLLILTLVAIRAHGSISLVVPALASIGTVDWELVVVWSNTVSVSVRVGEETTLWVCKCVCVSCDYHVTSKQHTCASNTSH